KVDDPKVQHDADAFVAGNTAMLFREAWVIGQIQKSAPNLDYDVAPIPRWAAGKPLRALLNLNGINVSGKSKNKEAAWAFTKFLCTRESQRKMTDISGWGSSRQDVDWSPLVAKIPQYAGFLTPPKDLQYFALPVIPPLDEIETRLAEKLAGAYADASLK